MASLLSMDAYSMLPTYGGTMAVQEVQQWLNGTYGNRQGFTHAGRYLVGAEEYITADEITELRDAGLRLVPIFQRYNDSADDMTYADGHVHGLEAVSRARVLGLPAGTPICFTVDNDTIGDAIAGTVFRYITGVNDALSATSCGFSVGVYGTRNVCQRLLDTGLATTAYVSGMSTGYAGNMGFPMPPQWSYNQIVETTTDLGQPSPTPIDKVVVSRRAEAVDLTNVSGPPIEQDGAASATGCSILFQWYVEAEARCQIMLNDQADSRIRLYKADPSRFILGWLRKPDHWGDQYENMRHYNTPAIDDDSSRAARSVCESALEYMPIPTSSSYDIAIGRRQHSPTQPGECPPLRQYTDQEISAAGSSTSTPCSESGIVEPSPAI